MSKITKVPLEGPDRAAFIEAANEAFEIAMDAIEPQTEKMTRALWDPEHFLDRVLLQPDMLPIDRDCALSLIDAFLGHHIIALAVEADERSDGTDLPPAH